MDITSNVNELNKMVSEGQTEEAFDKFYANNVSMQENNDEPMVGKDPNREREAKAKEMMKGVTEFKTHVANLAIEGNVSFTEWETEITFEDGKQMKGAQIARSVWNDEGQIINERYFHNRY